MITITQAQMAHLEDCKVPLLKSKLGQVYFTVEEKAISTLTEGITNRGMGIGQQLLRFFEETAFAQHSKVFLVLADFNPDARRLYERLGYQQVGAIPGLYREGVTEYLMMKLNPASKAVPEREDDS